MNLPRYLLLLLLLPISLAATENAADPQATPPKKPARRLSTASSRTKSAPVTITAEQLKVLQDALAAQDRRIQHLEQQLQQRDTAWQQVQSRLQRTEAAVTEAETKVSEVRSSSSLQQESYRKLQSDISDFKNNVTAFTATTKEEQKRVSLLQNLADRVRWTGELRVQQVNVFLAGQNPRVRERFRVRLGMEGQLNQDFVAGVAFASGTLTDPTSGNVDFTNFFERKTVGWDRGYVTYNPKAHKWLSLTGGKFAANWQKTSQTIKPDINPEGFSEKLSFDLKGRYLKNVTFNGLQFFYFENSNVKFGASGVDSFAAGGQVLLRLQPHHRWTITPSYLALNWHNANVILNAPAFDKAVPVSGTTNIVCNPVTALNTNPSCAFAIVPFAPSGMTNAYKVVSVAANGNLTRAFLSKFLYSDLILDSTIDTGLKRWPWRVMLEYEENLRSASNNSHIYQVETSFGQTKNQNDVVVGYAFLRQEQDSVLSPFNESDQRLPTNILQHKLYGYWRVRPNVLLGSTLYVGRVLNSSLFAPVAIPGSANTDALQTGFLAPGVVPGQVDRYLKRIQLDVIYSF